MTRKRPQPHPGATIPAEVENQLLQALDNLLAATVSLGIPPPQTPAVALDAALRTDRDYQRARRHFNKAWRGLMSAANYSSNRPVALKVEEKINFLVTQAVEVGWRVALLAFHQAPKNGS